MMHSYKLTSPHVVCDEFICMPNHIHVIIIIGESAVGTQFLASGNIASYISNNIIIRTDKNPSLQSPQLPKPSCVQGSLGAIIRGFKIGITKYVNQHNISFARQGRYHDSIVRDQHAYERIKYYIQQNPQNRKKDCFSEHTHYS